MGTNRHNEDARWSRSLLGDERAFAEIFDEHKDRVFRHTLRLCESVQDAEEVTAMTFFELWRKRDSVRLIDDSVLPWSLVTATNLARNLNRGRRRYRSMLGSLSPDPHGEAADETAISRMTLCETNPSLAAALALLPERDIQLLLLTTFEDLSTADAAALLGLAASTARSRLHRVRKRLGKQLLSTNQFLAATADEVFI